MAIRKKSARTNQSADRTKRVAPNRCSHCGAPGGDREGTNGRRRRTPARYDADEARVAPWGRRPDGTRHTQEEFRAFLRETVRELYGVSLPADEPASSSPVASASGVTE